MKAALYIDLDNMLGYCYSLSYRFDPQAVVSYIESKGDKLVLSKSYGSISAALQHLDNFLDEETVISRLHKAGIIYAHCSGRKNTADLALSLDALSTIDEFEILYLVSSDADFQPLVDRLADQGKRIVFIRMFYPNVSSDNGLTISETLYPSILGLDTEEGLDIRVLIYRDIIESVLKTSIISPDRLKEIIQEVFVQFESGISLYDLAKAVAKKDAFKVLRTALLGRGFVSDHDNKNILLAIKGGPEDLRSAFYRQCFFILRKKIPVEVSSHAMDKAFMLKGETFSQEEKRLRPVGG